MSESEWLASNDPARMLRFLSNQPPITYPRVGSDRKLRLFACACVRQVWNHVGAKDRELVGHAERYADGEDSLRLKVRPVACSRGAIEDYLLQVTVERAVSYAVACVTATEAREAATEAPEWLAKVLPFAVQADLLRDIIGNPFAPVRLPYTGKRDTVLYRPGDPVVLDDDARCPWLTPQVLTLAEAAYQDRPGRKCEKCPKWEGVRTDKYGYYEVDAMQAVIDHGERKKACVCNGTGRIEDGTLDPFRLALVADALEEAGCSSEEECWACRGGKGFLYCTYCEGTNRQPSPLLVHLRSAGPHYRGMWSLDVVLKKE